MRRSLLLFLCLVILSVAPAVTQEFQRQPIQVEFLLAERPWTDLASEARLLVAVEAQQAIPGIVELLNEWIPFLEFRVEEASSPKLRGELVCLNPKRPDNKPTPCGGVIWRWTLIDDAQGELAVPFEDWVYATRLEIPRKVRKHLVVHRLDQMVVDDLKEKLATARSEGHSYQQLIYRLLKYIRILDDAKPSLDPHHGNLWHLPASRKDLKIGTGTVLRIRARAQSQGDPYFCLTKLESFSAPLIGQGYPSVTRMLLSDEVSSLGSRDDNADCQAHHQRLVDGHLGVLVSKGVYVESLRRPKVDDHWIRFPLTGGD